MRSRLQSLMQLCRNKNIEVFWVSGKEAKLWRLATSDAYRAGWYWWSCCPGCLPDGDAIGPFTSPTRACENALYDE
ncbi:MAG TPA: hypothetical protein PLL30_16940 [Candidatus Krumholzibacteria bacterium]|nr:hypothetical protein [Candidatus Krumholzibacteria bacterium]HPD73461.1 hypothetical protein [Candidatus Krumholzibacteria bacterium]HRY42184.1 hypothetical protein [Candidatus Krumholzibacteria bacterium]